MYNINQAIQNGKFREKTGESLELRVHYNGHRYSFGGKTKAACKQKARQELEKLTVGVKPGKRTTLDEYMEKPAKSLKRNLRKKS